MTLIVTALTNTTFLKSYFLTIFSVQTLALLQEAKNGSFSEALVNNIPAQVLGFLGVIAGLIWIFRMGDDAWTNHLLNKSKAKMQDEKVEQEEIQTDLKRKKL